MRVMTAFLILALSAGSAAWAKPALRDVAEIDNGLMAVAIADAIRKSCDNIDARWIRATIELNRLERLALELGYGKQEVRAYITSKDEKARMRAKAEAFLQANGVAPDDRAALCRFGQREIQSQTEIGKLLR